MHDTPMKKLFSKFKTFSRFSSAAGNLQMLLLSGDKILITQNFTPH